MIYFYLLWNILYLDIFIYDVFLLIKYFYLLLNILYLVIFIFEVFYLINIFLFIMKYFLFRYF